MERSIEQLNSECKSIMTEMNLNNRRTNTREMVWYNNGWAYAPKMGYWRIVEQFESILYLRNILFNTFRELKWHTYNSCVGFLCHEYLNWSTFIERIQQITFKKILGNTMFSWVLFLVFIIIDLCQHQNKTTC